MISTIKKRYKNIKHAFKSTLEDLSEVIRVIRKRIEDQLWKIRLQHFIDKNGNIKVSLNIGIFCYFRHEISEYTLDLITNYAKAVNVTTVLPDCIGVFTKTLTLSSKYKI